MPIHLWFPIGHIGSQNLGLSDHFLKPAPLDDQQFQIPFASIKCQECSFEMVPNNCGQCVRVRINWHWPQLIGTRQVLPGLSGKMRGLVVLSHEKERGECFSTPETASLNVLEEGAETAIH
ncbi:MAG: hypothetical protein ABJN75_17775 [Hoeflea sp.]|uniref:hypothetical protein n=1 Tax=Hoeflea sp. TaxID=1940281 RepID=UPI003297D8B6